MHVEWEEKYVYVVVKTLVVKTSSKDTSSKD